MSGEDVRFANAIKSFRLAFKESVLFSSLAYTEAGKVALDLFQAVTSGNGIDANDYASRAKMIAVAGTRASKADMAAATAFDELCKAAMAWSKKQGGK